MKREQSLRIYQDAVAIVTGGASGIGRALGEALARQGARVVLADRQFDLAKEVADGICASGGHAVAEQLDVTDFSATNSLVQDTFLREKRLDYIFNNAGIGIAGEARLYELDDWYRILDVNLRGVIHGVQAAYPIMLRQGFGHIVNTSSLAGLLPSPLVVGYSMTKHAIVGLSLSLRIEAAAAGIRVSVLCPGVIRTAALVDCGKFGKMLQPVTRETQKRLFDLQRPMQPQMFAERALRAVAKNQAIIVIPSWWRIAWWLYRLSPSLGLSLGAWGRRKYLEAAKQSAADLNADPPGTSDGATGASKGTSSL